jgi:hypothetical protein
MATREASYPFNKSTADAILRSKDRVDFRVHTIILAESSAFFGDMFALPQPGDDDAGVDGKSPLKAADGSQHSLPVIDVSEDSATLDKVLRFCYSGVEDPTMSTLDDLHPILEAAKKYQMELATQTIKRRMLVFAPEEPLRVYALAYLYDMGDIARVAARAALRRPMMENHVRELDNIPATAYHHFLDYHRKAQQAVTALTIDFRWIPVGVPVVRSDFRVRNTLPEVTWDAGRVSPWFNCNNCKDTARTCVVSNGNSYNPTRWWTAAMDRAGQMLMERPSGDTVLDPAIVEPATTAALACAACGKYSSLSEFKSFMHYFAREVEKKVAEVRIIEHHTGNASD